MSGEVRLWREPVEGPPEFIPENPGDPVTERSYIALPAAEFDAWRRVVEAARARRDYELGRDGVAMTMAADRERHRELARAENAALDAMPYDQQPGRAGG